MTPSATPTRTLCGAKTRGGKGPPCRKTPIAGGNRCRFHGGGSPQAKAKAAERLALAKAHKYLQQLGEDHVPHRDSYEALQDLGNQASLLVDLLRGVIARLDTVSSDGGAGVGEQIRGEVQAYLQAMTRAESVHGRILSLNLEARRVLVEEEKAQFIAGAMKAALEAADLSPAQQAAAMAVLRMRLDDEPTTAQRQINAAR
jgi:hypothetical protein